MLFGQIHALRVHRIDAHQALAHLGPASKLNSAWPFVWRLHQLGRQAADQWLPRNPTHVGRRFTLPLEAYT